VIKIDRRNMSIYCIRARTWYNMILISRKEDSNTSQRILGSLLMEYCAEEESMTGSVSFHIANASIKTPRVLEEMLTSLSEPTYIDDEIMGESGCRHG